MKKSLYGETIIVGTDELRVQLEVKKTGLKQKHNESFEKDDEIINQ